MVETIRIGGIQNVSSVDWYGRISTVFFLSGCNFRCQFCYNTDLLDSEYGEDYTVDRIKEILTYNELLIDSVVFTGGEPTLQWKELRGVLKMIRETWPEWGIMINTNGGDPNALYELMKEDLIDRVAIDAKTDFTGHNYGEVTGVPAGWFNAITSMKWVGHFGKELEVRTTIVTDLTDNPLHISNIALTIKNWADEYHLQQCYTIKEMVNPELNSRPPPDYDIMVKLAIVALKEGVKAVYIKTLDKGIEKISDQLLEI